MLATPSTAPTQSPGVALSGAVLLVVLPVVFLRAALGALSANGERVVWVNPSVALAGFGFLGLWMVLVGFCAVRLARARSASLALEPSARGWLAGLLIVVAGGLAWRAENITNAYASLHGYVRCASLDRLEAGNVKRNDVTTHAYFRLSSGDEPTSCAPAAPH